MSQKRAIPKSTTTPPGLLNRLDERFFAPVTGLNLLRDWTPRGGHQGGRYLNQREGGSLEFKQHRSYVPGDDVRRVDWGVYGRTKKLFTRLVEAEHIPELIIAIDHSASMAAGGAEGKFGSALEYALLLAYVALQSDYRVKFVPFGPSNDQEMTPEVSLVHSKQILSFARERMAHWQTLGATDFSALGEQSLAWRHSGACLVVVSDFLLDVSDDDLASRFSSDWFNVDNQDEFRAFQRARRSAQNRILASLSRLHAALEPLKTPNVRAVLMAVTGAGERNLSAARSVLDLESGFLHRVLFTRASERAYQAALTAHRIALKTMTKNLGLGFVSVEGKNDNEQSLEEMTSVKRQAILDTLFSLGFGAYNPSAISQGEKQ